MQHNKVKAALRAGETVLGSCLTDYYSPEVITIAKAAGMDFVFVDTEHSPPDYREIQTLVRVARAAEVAVIVRVTQAEYYLIARALDVGATGIIAPRIHSLDQARSVVSAMKFTPDGERGYGLRNIVNDFTYQGARQEMDSANQETLVVLQMESSYGVEAIYDITAVRGVDAILVGPFDLSISLGIPGDFESPIFWDAFDRMVDACGKNDVAPGVHFPSIKMLNRARDHGARFLVFSSDVGVLLDGWKRARQDLKIGG